MDTIDKKTRVLKKALTAGLCCEKDYSNLSAREFFELEKSAGFSKDDAQLFFELADAIKQNKLITYLGKEDTQDEREQG